MFLLSSTSHLIYVHRFRAGAADDVGSAAHSDKDEVQCLLRGCGLVGRD